MNISPVNSYNVKNSVSISNSNPVKMSKIQTCQSFQGAYSPINSLACKAYNYNSISFAGQTESKINNSTKHYWGPVLSADKIDAPIDNFYKINDKFYRGAQPGLDETQGGKIHYNKLKEGLKYLRDELNLSVILNLRNPNDNNTKHIELEQEAILELNHEAKLLNAKNPLNKQIPQIEGVNIFMDAGEAIPVKSEIVEKIMGLFQKHSDQGIFIHCRSGNDRTGVTAALYRIWKQGTEMGVSFHDIRQEMLSCGHNQGLFPKLIPSLASCLRYMGITPEFERIKNAKGEKNFLLTFYQANRNYIKSIANIV